MANEQQLSRQLKEAGIDDIELEGALTRRMKLGLPSFALPHKKMFGTETVDYDIHFRRLNDAGDYRIEHYEATYNFAIEVQHSVIDGMDTSRLEDTMASIDWSQLYQGGEMHAMVRDVSDLLWKLRESGHIGAFPIQQALMLKYWSGTPYDSPELQERRKQLLTSRKFINGEGGLFNAFLCYYELSGARQGIKDIFRRRGFNCDSQIDDYLSSDQAFFELNTYKSCTEGLMHYRVPVRRIDYDNFLIPEYTATLVKMPFVESPAILGINIANLDSAMSAIDWSDTEDNFIRLDDGSFVPNTHVDAIKLLVLNLLPGDPAGRIISSQLQAKYWVTSPDFYKLVEPIVFDYLQTLPYASYDFPIDTHTKAAYNLLCGRAVQVGIGHEAALSDDVWWKLEAKDGDSARLFLLPFTSLSRQQLELLVSRIPAAESELVALTSGLLEGDRAEVRLNTGKSIWVEVDAEGHTLKLMDEQGKPIHLNLDMTGPNEKKHPVNFRPFLSEQEIQRPAKGLFRSKRRQ